ncbi:MAG: bacillithiol biosynthesis BshC, partial [Planctomycetota bacterium]
TLTLVETRFERLMRDENISFEELSGDIEQVVNKVLARTFPTDLEELFVHLRRHVHCHFEDLSRGSLEFDPSLKKFAEQTFGKIEYTLKAFEGKVFSSHKKKQQQTRDRIYRLWHALYPNRGMQERALNISYFISKYGREIISYVHDRMNEEETGHQLLFLSERE